MDLNLFFNELSIPKQESLLFEKDPTPLKQFLNMLILLWPVTHINLNIQTDIKNKLVKIIIPYKCSHTEHHFWKLFLDRSCDIKWKDETFSAIFNEEYKYYIEDDSRMDALMLYGAILENLIAISFNINKYFNSHEIFIIKENNGELTKSTIDNISSENTAKLVVLKHSNELSQKEEVKLFSILYSNIKFCDTAINDYCGIKGDKVFIKQARNILVSLNKCVEETVEGVFDVSNYCPNVSPDTPETLKRDKGERKVKCPDGTNFCFSYHVKLSAIRVYFDTRYSPERCILIGRMFPISQHPS